MKAGTNPKTGISDRLTNAGNRLVNLAASLLLIFLLLMCGYSLWYTWYINHNSYLSDEIARYKPGEGDDSLSLSDLMKRNPDVVGWLTIDGTNIDYPVVQGKDDMEYLNKDALGNFSISGSIFLSSRNQRDFSDSYNIVYGHHMDNGTMFGEIEKFCEKEFFDAHESGMLMLPEEEQKIELFACVSTDAYDETIYVSPEEVPPGQVEEFALKIKEKAGQYREIHIQDQERIIALSTCTEAATNGRILLFGRLNGNE